MNGIPYTCPLCGHYCSKKSDLERHLVRKEPCQPMTDDLKIQLDQAIIAYNLDINRIYPCNFCPLVFRRSDARGKHHDICPSRRPPQTQGEQASAVLFEMAGKKANDPAIKDLIKTLCQQLDDGKKEALLTKKRLNHLEQANILMKTQISQLIKQIGEMKHN